jgi:hypothetical protein
MQIEVKRLQRVSGITTVIVTLIRKKRVMATASRF